MDPYESYLSLVKQAGRFGDAAQSFLDHVGGAAIDEGMLGAAVGTVSGGLSGLPRDGNGERHILRNAAIGALGGGAASVVIGRHLRARQKGLQRHYEDQKPHLERALKAEQAEQYDNISHAPEKFIEDHTARPAYRAERYNDAMAFHHGANAIYAFGRQKHDPEDFIVKQIQKYKPL